MSENDEVKTTAAVVDAAVTPVLPAVEIMAPAGHRALSFVESEAQPIALGGWAFEDFKQLLVFATQIAEELRQVIRQHEGLVVYIKGAKKPHITVSAWSTMLAMLGVVPVEVRTTVDERGVYTAYVELRRVRDGALVGGGSAECGNPDETDREGRPTWADRAAFARHSMAITRATGKAARLSFAWIVEMAGYAPRAAEEMPGFEPDSDEAGETIKRYENQWEEPVISFLVSTQLVDGDTERKAAVSARHILNYAPFREVPFGKLDVVDAVAWVYGWRQAREKHPSMKPALLAGVVLGGWNDVPVKAEWINWALDQIPPESPKGGQRAPAR
jgi:hypothetical protein